MTKLCTAPGWINADDRRLVIEALLIAAEQLNRDAIQTEQFASRMIGPGAALELRAKSAAMVTLYERMRDAAT